jgi:hypothetical protein
MAKRSRTKKLSPLTLKPVRPRRRNTATVSSLTDTSPVLPSKRPRGDSAITKPKGKQERNRAFTLKKKQQLQFQVRLLILALEEATDYQSRPHSNDPVPELYRTLELDNPANRDDIKSLISELRRLNDYLENSRGKTKGKSVIEVRDHLNTWIKTFAKVTATGAGLLAMGVAATVLRDTGYFDPTVIPMPKLANR